MKAVSLFFILLISLTVEQDYSHHLIFSNHGEYCDTNSPCKEGFDCLYNRCYTQYESKNFDNLGIHEGKVCEESDPDCIKKNSQAEEDKGENVTSIKLIFGGSVSLNQKAYLSGMKYDHTLNYDHLFNHISSIIKDADLSFIEQETVFDTEDPIKYEETNQHMPKELGDALATAGFNVILHANPHAFDQSEKGIKDTLEFWRNKYPFIQNLGISATVEESQKDYIIYTKDDLKIGIINSACGDFNKIPGEIEYMVNSLDLRKVEEIVKKVKSEVDFLIFYLNWGDKDYYLPSRTQIRIAKILAWHGVDLIIGNMPNVIFPVSFLKPESGKEILVFWSVGSLIGNNALKYHCLAALANVVITKRKGKTYISSHSLIPIISHQIQSEFSFYKFSDYTLDLGYKTDEEFSMDIVKNKCKKVFGPLADC